MGKTGHEMWTDSLYSWLVNCSEDSCNIVPIHMKKLQMTCPRTQACGGRVRTSNSDVTNHRLQYLILPGVQKIQLTCKGFWMQCPNFIASLSQASSKPPRHRAEWAWVKPWQQICGVFTNINQFPRHLLGIPQSIDAWYEIHAVPTGLKTVLTLVPVTCSLVTYTCDLTAEMWRFHDPT